MPVRRKRTTPAVPAQRTHRSRYGIDPEVIASGRLPEKPPLVTSAKNPHYQKKFDGLHALAKAGNWQAVRDYKVTGSNSYSNMLERYRQNVLALHAASGAA